MTKRFAGIPKQCDEGKFNAFEKVAKVTLMGNMICSEEAEEQMTEFELSGLDVEALEYMHAGERRRVLEEAGLNPNEYDF